MSDLVDESLLVAGLRRGDQEAWDALCRQYSDRLWKTIARLIGRDSDSVADVFQETMLALAKASSSLAEDTKIWPWLSKVAHNQSALFWRKHYRRRESTAEVDDVPSKSDAFAELARSEASNTIRDLLNDMNAEYVALLTSKYIDDMSIEEIVLEFGGSSESVRSKLARARRDFRQRYQRVVTQS